MESESREACEFDKDQLLLKLDMTIAAGVEAITPVVDQVLNLARSMSCARGKEFEIEAALREALMNAIVHGCGADTNKLVQLSVSCDHSRGMLIVVRDPGPGFNVDQVPSPVVGENIYSFHGRGIYLINQLMDQVSFDRGGTEIRMLKK